MPRWGGVARHHRKTREPHRPKRMCTHGRWTAYDTKRIARVAAARMSLGVGVEIHPFKCRWCRCWHLTKVVLEAAAGEA
jgi:hypothetical protein